MAKIPVEQIPEDLYEAIMSMVPVIFNMSQTSDKKATDQYKKAADHAALLLQPWVRTKGITFRPIYRV